MYMHTYVVEVESDTGLPDQQSANLDIFPDPCSESTGFNF
jgi:hypothetical protein